MTLRQIKLESALVRVHDQGQGRPLLFVHGFPLDHTMWLDQLEHFADDYRVLAPDLPGFGQSGPIPPAEYAMSRYADDLANLLDQLQVTDPVILCGLSMGGYVGWQFWHRHRDRLASLIMCDTRAQCDSEEIAKGRRYMAERVLEHGSTAVADEMLPKLFAAETLEARPEFLDRTLDVMRSTRRETIAAAQRAMANRTDMTRQLSEIQLPALLIAGEHDMISTPKEMNLIAASMPNAEFVSIAEAGHMAPLERPDEVNQTIRRFLDRG